MATTVDTRREGSELGALIAAYLHAAETGRTLDRSGAPYSPAGVRSLRRALAQVEAAAGPLEPAELSLMDAAALDGLARRVVEHAGLPPSRVGTIVDALRGLAAYTGAGRTPAAPSQSRSAAAPEAPTPTFTMLALGSHLSAWMERIIVIAFVLTVIGLALELV